ncbi:hypothetical protein [Specibacter sp. RAF43]|uniref:hypothetical protein n=1 Tax=Specibacter sp. RAF43 TaxID=3233057 RepID=UPI003F9E6FA7
MSSNPGQDQPATGGNNDDDAVWLDLVARLQEPSDEFLESSQDPDASAPGSGLTPEGTGPAGTSPAGRTSDGTPTGDAAAGQRAEFIDFDPLGVWRNQAEPAPAEPPSGQGFDDQSFGGPRDYAGDDDEDSFVPAEPPSLSAAEPAVLLAWIGAAGGPIFLVLAAIFWRGIPLLGVIAVVLAFLVGTGYLLYRLPANRDHDDGDGAVV